MAGASLERFKTLAKVAPLVQGCVRGGCPWYLTFRSEFGLKVPLLGGGKAENGRCPLGNWKSDSILDDARTLSWAFRHRLKGKLASWTKWHHWKWFVPGLLALHERRTRKPSEAPRLPMLTFLRCSSPMCGKPLSPEVDFPVLDLPGVPQMGFCDIKCLWVLLRDEAGKRFSGLEKW